MTAEARLAVLYAAAREAIARLAVEGDVQRPVFGEGAAGARLMLVGEAPGREEAEAGRPFVGKAGKNLAELLAGAGLAREQAYITNAVKYRPTHGKRNRTPTRAEVAEGRALLLQEVALVGPRVIATLGNTPLLALGVKETVGVCHGVPQQTPAGTVFALYHPASVIYNRALAPVLAADIAALAAYLGGE